MNNPIVLVADCPWKLNDQLPGPGRGAEKHYSCLDVEQLKTFPLPVEVSDASAAVLFFWRLASMPEEAYQVIRAWGFVPKAELVWVKKTKNDLVHFGMGNYTRASHETAIIAIKGKPSDCRPGLKNVRSIFETDLAFEAQIGRHSEKPDEFYNIVEQMYPESKKFELFARTVRPGWTQEGDELEA